MQRRDLLAEVNGLSQETLLAGLLIVAAFIQSCVNPALSPETGPPVGEYAPGPSSQGYGVGGGVITAHQLSMVEALSWPQTRDDMIGTLGFPHSMTEWADYYTVPSGQTLVIHYSGPSAVDYTLEN
ncbi:hypothetical protein PGN35_000655 [Nodosilinea sp. PGN35]|uniref:hypothetical protein n=1 Tax=Nodosilinea sp. PGN35 TaxID=3020489 RepID=UPI0023B30740|nr:hypothetical protein [Nodosilinea sp. TSF1-S3]MDF0369077.1 hypothetical protein [Nodosilinea sp. TSF1-S3]